MSSPLERRLNVPTIFQIRIISCDSLSEKSVEESTEESAEESTGEILEESTDEVTEESTDEVTEKSTEECAVRSILKTSPSFVPDNCENGQSMRRVRFEEKV